MIINLDGIASIRIKRHTKCSACTKCLPYAASADGQGSHCNYKQCYKLDDSAKIVLFQQGDSDTNVIIINIDPHNLSDLPITIEGEASDSVR